MSTGHAEQLESTEYVGMATEMLSTESVPVDYYPPNCNLQRSAPLHTIYIGPYPSVYDIHKLELNIRRSKQIGWSVRPLCFLIEYTSWKRHDRIRDLILGSNPFDMPYVEICVTNHDPAKLFEAFIVRNLYFHSNSESLLIEDLTPSDVKWMSTFTSHLDTFDAEQPMLIPNIVVLDILPCSVPSPCGLMDGQQESARENLMAYFNSAHFLRNRFLIKLALPRDISRHLPVLMTRVRQSSTLEIFELYKGNSVSMLCRQYLYDIPSITMALVELLRIGKVCLPLELFKISPDDDQLRDLKETWQKTLESDRTAIGISSDENWIEWQ